MQEGRKCIFVILQENLFLETLIAAIPVYLLMLYMENFFFLISLKIIVYFQFLLVENCPYNH